MSMFYVLGFIVIGLGSLSWALHEKHRARRAAGWPTVQGIVRRVAVRQVLESGRGDPVEMLGVRYVYDVEGRLYTGNRRCFGELLDDASDEEIASRYVEGSGVTVHFNAGEPQDAVLEPRSANFTAVLTIGIVFLVLAGVLCFVGLSQSPMSQRRLARILLLAMIPVCAVLLAIRRTNRRIAQPVT